MEIWKWISCWDTEGGKLINSPGRHKEAWTSGRELGAGEEAGLCRRKGPQVIRPPVSRTNPPLWRICHMLHTRTTNMKREQSWVLQIVPS